MVRPSKIARVISKYKAILLLVSLFVALCIYDKSFLALSLHMVNLRVLMLLASMMAISRAIELSGLLSRLANILITVSRGSVKRIMVLLILSTALVSSILMNDTSLFVFVPLALAIARYCGVDRVDAVALVTIAANVGSQLTPIGNPQNMLIWTVARVPFWFFVKCMTIPTIASLALLYAYMYVKLRCAEQVPIPPKTRVNVSLAIASIMSLLLVLIIIQSKFWYISIVIALLTAIISRRLEVLKAIDVALLLLFALIFIDFRMLGLIISSCNIHVSKTYALFIGIALSQVISNVPASAVLIQWLGPKYWYVIAIACNYGGNGTIVSSLANMIAAKLGGVTYRDLQRKTLPFLAMSIPVAWALSSEIV